jgi:hypothetical protein
MEGRALGKQGFRTISQNLERSSLLEAPNTELQAPEKLQEPNPQKSDIPN